MATLHYSGLSLLPYWLEILLTGQNCLIKILDFTFIFEFLVAHVVYATFLKIIKLSKDIAV